MSVSKMLANFLKEQGIDYRLVLHAHTGSSMDTAQAAHVPGRRLAKAVVIRVGDRYLLVALPADYHVDLARLEEYLGESATLAEESELARLFPDCEVGAVPPIGGAFALRTLVDRHLLNLAEIYFESGDHEQLIKLSGDQFGGLMRSAEEVDVGRHL